MYGNWVSSWHTNFAQVSLVAGSVIIAIDMTIAYAMKAIR